MKPKNADPEFLTVPFNFEITLPPHKVDHLLAEEVLVVLATDTTIYLSRRGKPLMLTN